MRNLRPTGGILAALIFAAVALASHAAHFQAQAQPANGTQPIPASLGWSQESINGLNAINQFRAQQTPPLAPLQIDAVLQYAAAWEVNDQMTNGQCFGQSGNPQGAGYYPYAPANPSPTSVCPHTDSLGRDPFARVAAFGYTGGASENADFGGGDQTPAPVAMGQQAFQDWYDLLDPDPVTGLPTYAHRKNLINPQWTVVGLARQCDVFVHRCFWAFDPGTCLMMAFTPPAGTPPPPAAANPAPACQNAAPVTLPPATLQPAPAPTFMGTWAVDKFDSGAQGVLSLTQTGNQVTGTYSFTDPTGCGTETGTLTGTTSGTGDQLTYSNSDSGCGAPNSYSGSTTRLSADGLSFTSGTRWNGKLCGGAAPACPVVAAATTQPANTTTQPANTTTQPTTGPTTVTQPTTGPTTIPQPTVTTTVTQPTTTTTTAPAAGAGGWAGSWNTDFGPITLALNGNQASGTYSYADPNNVPTTLSVTGTANGNTMTGTFGITPPTPAFGGPFTFTLSADGSSFTGMYTLPGNNTGSWNGTRTGP